MHIHAAGLKLIFGDMQGCHALPLALQLVTAQESAYEELGVEFPYWNGRRLAIKEIEHALCEYCKFRKVTGPRNTSQQAYRSRSHLDENVTCTLCRNETGDDCYLCDKCNQSFCTKCVPVEPEGIYWSCRRCEKFENQYE